MPKNSFDKYQFFTLQDAPCNGCSEEIFTKDTIIMNQEKYYADRFLMNNTQAKVRLFNKNQLKIRVPKEYVDTTDNYFASYSVGKIDDELEWKTKRGKRKQNYYYSTIRFYGTPQFTNGIFIYRKRLTTTCLNYYKNTGYGNSFSFCGTGRGRGSFPFGITLEPGAFYHNDTLTGFLTLGIVKYNEKWNASLNGGINTHKGFYGSLKFQYNYYSFPLKALSPVNRWQSATEQKSINNYGTLYVGTDFKTSFNRSYQSFLEANLHVGISVELFSYSRFFNPSLYLHGGLAKDTQKKINPKIYPFAQIGLLLRLG